MKVLECNKVELNKLKEFRKNLLLLKENSDDAYNLLYPLEEYCQSENETIMMDHGVMVERVEKSIANLQVLINKTRKSASQVIKNLKKSLSSYGPVK